MAHGSIPYERGEAVAIADLNRSGKLDGLSPEMHGEMGEGPDRPGDTAGRQGNGCER